MKKFVTTDMKHTMKAIMCQGKGAPDVMKV